MEMLTLLETTVTEATRKEYKYRCLKVEARGGGGGGGGRCGLNNRMKNESELTKLEDRTRVVLNLKS